MAVLHGKLMRGAVGCIVIAGACFCSAQRAQAQTAIDVTIKDHRFTPSEIHVPAGKPAVLNIKNEDATAEEFDSSALKIEKVIGGGKEGSVRLRPLDPGNYPFMGEYHEDTAKGVVIAE
ncbi:MAG: cupredoxin domain-containing protein [Methyloceanibacter sp.]|jgi:plastocyanin